MTEEEGEDEIKTSPKTRGHRRMSATWHMNPVLQARDPDSQRERALSSLREEAVTETPLQPAQSLACENAVGDQLKASCTWF